MWSGVNWPKYTMTDSVRHFMNVVDSDLQGQEVVCRLVSRQQFHELIDYDTEEISTRLKYFTYGEIFVLALIGKKIIGLVSMDLNPSDKSILWFMGISVDPEYRNKGIAKMLIERVFTYAKTKKLKIKRSSPSPLGAKYLPSIWAMMKARYPDVRIIPADSDLEESSVVLEQFSYKNEMRNHYKGQNDLTLSLYDEEEYVGHIDYSEYHGEIHIQMIDVPKDKRRNGYATMLLKHLQKLFPKAEIQWGSLTQDGAALKSKIKTNRVIDPDIQQKMNRLEALKIKEKEYQSIADRYYEMQTNTNRMALDAALKDWNDLSDEIRELEYELHGTKSYKDFIKE